MKAAVAACLVLLTALPLWAETFRIALYNTELSQKGPGLLLRGLEQHSLPRADAVIDVIENADPDILVLQNFDWDLQARTLKALQSRLSERGLTYPHLFTARPNSGMPTGLDMDGDGRTGGPRDAQGYGDFVGAHGMAVLSRYPVMSDQLVDLSDQRWTGFPWADLPQFPDERPFPSAEAQAQQRLSSTNHWILPVRLSQDAQVDLMIFNPTPPVFDGAEDRNGKRNHDEIALWTHVLDSDLAPAHPVIVIGDANLDPLGGDGLHAAIQSLLNHPRLQDPRPTDPAGHEATVNWQQTGPLRVDYILPDARLMVRAAGIAWPDDANTAAEHASRHGLVWLDVDIP
ncbi:endonuclease/exonuclease/phosphatase family protein [Epibacterium ulvae]|uniref:endonuclease/exonuclease/phosphatase family protein n=1 Tax=Epibacterium ulvae TaxID=1156985 RepID=UPI001BFC329B|nr:endonuclease/exonuclease/phosphatase family protein [Epibacterium ulvae]MBT8153802.1 endonuclease/exonuclease/phosphatase family protein [Epibacterium ulvae]